VEDKRSERGELRMSGDGGTDTFEALRFVVFGVWDRDVNDFWNELKARTFDSKGRAIFQFEDEMPILGIERSSNTFLPIQTQTNVF
jgi:hypothetical protein